MDLSSSIVIIFRNLSMSIRVPIYTEIIIFYDGLQMKSILQPRYILPPTDARYYWTVRDTCSLPQVTGLSRCSFVDFRSVELQAIFRSTSQLFSIDYVIMF